jgi:hypothetical protein
MLYEIPDSARGITKFRSLETRREMQTWPPLEFDFFLEHFDRELYCDLLHILYFTDAILAK